MHFYISCLNNWLMYIYLQGYLLLQFRKKKAFMFSFFIFLPFFPPQSKQQGNKHANQKSISSSLNSAPGLRNSLIFLPISIQIY